MLLSKNLCAIAILAGSISSVLGALNLVQITNAIEDLTNRINNAISTASNINVATGDLMSQTLTTNNNDIASRINGINEALVGSNKLTKSQANSLTPTVSEYAGRLAALFEKLGDDAPFFEIPANQNMIQSSANALNQNNNDLIGNLETIAPSIAPQLDQNRVNTQAANGDMNTKFANSPLRRARAFRA